MPDRLITEALEQFKESEERTSSWREQAKEDYKFAEGDQWPAEYKAMREAQRLPVLTIDRLEGPISQLVGDQRQNDIEIKVLSKRLHHITAVDGERVEETKVLDGLVREIQRQSRFDAIQSYAF